MIKQLDSGSDEIHALQRMDVVEGANAVFFYMHDGEHGLPLVANAWHKTGYNWFEGKEDDVNHTISSNNAGRSEYNEAKAKSTTLTFPTMRMETAGRRMRRRTILRTFPSLP
jgi:hypothetical protein